MATGPPGDGRAANTAARWTRLMRMMFLLAGAVARQRPDAMVCDTSHAALAVS